MGQMCSSKKNSYNCVLKFLCEVQFKLLYPQLRLL